MTKANTLKGLVPKVRNTNKPPQHIMKLLYPEEFLANFTTHGQSSSLNLFWYFERPTEQLGIWYEGWASG